MIVYPPIFYCAELKLAFKGKITRKVADTLHEFIILQCWKEVNNRNKFIFNNTCAYCSEQFQSLLRRMYACSKLSNNTFIVTRFQQLKLPF